MIIKQQLTDRMKLRITAIAAVKGAILPAFCEDMACDHSCPLFNTGIREPCDWMKTYEAINRMELKMLKEKKV